MYVVALSAVLFTMGVVGVLIRRNAIIAFMSVELMLNSANLAFIAFARSRQQSAGRCSSSSSSPWRRPKWPSAWR